MQALECLCWFGTYLKFDILGIHLEMSQKEVFLLVQKKHCIIATTVRGRMAHHFDTSP